MALFRALESARPAGKALFCDALAEGFIDHAARLLVRASAVAALRVPLIALIDKSWPGARTSAVARTRLIDDWVIEGIAQGCRQLVLLGAGFDSRPWRLPELLDTSIFEVDHPSTTAEKSARIRALGADPSRVVTVPLDFARDRLLDRLATAGFDATKTTMVVWEGVTNYLTDDAVCAVLCWAGTLKPGSRLAFTYIHQGVLTDPTSFAGAPKILRAVASTGEPWTFGLLPEAVPGYVAPYGLRLLDDLGADDYRSRYFGTEATTMRGYSFYRAALATVAHIDA
jgi:methyltransferase (TIGR00027 family)